MPSKSNAAEICLGLILLLPWSSTAQTQTSGRIAGFVRDAQGAALIGAQVIVTKTETAEQRTTVTDGEGNFAVSFMPPAIYEVSITAYGFQKATLHNVAVRLTATTTLNIVLPVANSNVEVTVDDETQVMRNDSSELSMTLDSRSLAELPQPTHNFLQLVILAPGASVPLTNNNALGRNSPNLSTNGARLTQNSYQINGVDANDTTMHTLSDVAVPAADSISEVKLQTSMFDSLAGTGGSNLAIVTKSGSNDLHGSAYEYFQNETLNANDANLRAVGLPRPEMSRNVYGLAVGGPVRKNKTFFFGSYQGMHETNGATDQSLYKSILIVPGLTDDRSEATLKRVFSLTTIDPTSLALLNWKLPDGKYLIPTPQTRDGRVTGTAISTYHEEQFNSNLDLRLTQADSLSAKFFFANAQLFSALGGSNFGLAARLPGFGNDIRIDNGVLSLVEVHTFNSTTVNECRFGTNLILHDESPQESVRDTDLNMQRSTAAQYPGLPLIVLARDQGGASIGTSDITLRYTTPSVTLNNILSLQRGRHFMRLGGGFRHEEWNVRSAVYSYGEIDFPTFNDFLVGNTGPSQFLVPPTDGFAHLGTGLTDRNFRTTDYHLFVQDDWKVSSSLTLNLGLRYEIDPPPYDTKGRISTFDPALYRPRMEVDASGFPVGPPSSGLVRAGNAPPEYSLPGVPRVDKRMVTNIDLKDFGPRVGLAWSPLSSGRLALRWGYGIFYSRPSFFYLALNFFAPPFFLDSNTSGQPFDNPFASAPPSSAFPLVQTGSPLNSIVLDRNMKTPYVQQFNGSVQYELMRETTLQIAYVGSRGLRLLRTVAINQPPIASLNHPVVNSVTGSVITTNTPENAALRAPMQGVDPHFFALNQTNGQSTYHSLQATLSRQWSAGLQFTVAYALSKSIDDGSGPGGGATSDGTIDRTGGFDTGSVLGDQLNPRSNRGLSDFDRKHRLVASFVWQLPMPRSIAKRLVTQHVFGDWQVAGIVTTMSGLPIDIIDSTGGSLYGFQGARPNWSPNATRETAMSDVPLGYYFNPAAFAQAVVQPGNPIPSAHDPTALAVEIGTDFGTVGRNVLRGPSQNNVDLSLSKYFHLGEKKRLESRADFLNAFNHANKDNPISDITSADFGRIVSFSSSPRIIQLGLKLSF